VPAVEIAGRSVEELSGLGIDPLGIALDVWVEGVSRRDLAEVAVLAPDGERLTLPRGTAIGGRERYRLGLADLELFDGVNELSLSARDASGAEWTRDLRLEVVRGQLAIEGVDLVDAAGSRDDDGELPRCNRSAGRYVISPRTRPALSVQLSRAADVAWIVSIDDSGQTAVLRDSSTGRGRFEAGLEDLAQLRGGQPYEGRIRIVAREDAYVLHGENSTPGSSEALLHFRYENAEPRFVAQWVSGAGARDLEPQSAERGPLFTNVAEGDVLVTRSEQVPMKLDVAWWPADDPERVRIVESSDLRNLQAQQASLHVALQDDGRYGLRVRSYRYDTSADETTESPDFEASYALVLDRSAPTYGLAGIEDGQILRDANGAPPGVDVRFDAPEHGEQPAVDLDWSLALLTGTSWSTSGRLPECDPVSAARITLAPSWNDLADAEDGRYRFELEGTDRAGNQLVPRRIEFEVAVRGPDLRLEQPSGIGKWHPDPPTGTWRVRVRARDANGVDEHVACAVLVPGDASGIPVPLRPEAGSTRDEKVFEGTLSLPYTLSEKVVSLSLDAADGHGSRTSWTSGDLELPAIQPPQPRRLAVRLAAHDVEPMRLVRGNAEYPYVFGGRGDEIENAEFVTAGLVPFNSSPRKSRPRSWQVEYAAGRIEGFYLDEREVSVTQFLAFLRDPDGWARASNWSAVEPDFARLPALAGRLAELDGEQSVTGVTWHEAAAYARWVGKRLPTWVEWEFAVRGGGSYRAFSAQAEHAPAFARGTSGDWTPDGGFADLCTNAREWTSTPADFQDVGERPFPHRWAG
jgi:hypothetical protein